MKFIVDNDGAPDIPERLLQNHEEGKVIFFCGAGISYDAGLPGFKDLVVKVYKKLGCSYNQFQEEAIKNGQLDLAITLLEKDNIYTKSKIKEEINKILSSPKLDDKSVTLHKALLKLSKTKDNKLKLVTTNFDRVFESLKLNNKFYSYVAPALPIINADWDGLIYLHGLLNEENTNPIVISSGDFGQAYLIDRWAARFMGQLLKKYSVCFVGYSLNDPILRYMTDAIAAGKNAGESAPEIFAFCDYNKRGKYTKKEYIIEKWKTKGVIPIPYNKKNNHSLLKKTFSAWADSYSKGFQGKVQEVIKLSESKPSASTDENDIVKKLIWALSDSTGKAAEAFANNNPIFDFSWLYALNDTKYKGKDLSLFGISCQNLDEEYSIINRPVAEKNKIPIQSIVSNRYEYEYDYSDNIFEGIYNWLLRHINNPDLIIWISKNGGLLNINFKNKIIRQLNKFDEWETENNVKSNLEKEQYLLDNPNGIPNQEMRILWDLVLSDKLCKFRDYLNLYRNSNNFKKNGINISNKNLLIKALTSFVIIEKGSNNKFSFFGDDEESISIFSTLNLNVEIDINVSHFLLTMKNFENWKRSLNNCVLDFTLLLKEYCDLNFKLGKKILEADYSYIDIDDISNIDIHYIYHHNSYATLLYLLWNSWYETNNQNPKYANDILKIFWNIPYPIFKRLTYFALSKQETIDFNFAYNCLKNDNCKWLWAQNTRNETFQLLKKIAKDCEVNSIKLIEDLLMRGEACNIYPNIEEKDRLDEIFSINLYDRLDTIKRVNPNFLSKNALEKYNEIKEKYSLSTFDGNNHEKPFHELSDSEKDLENVQLPKNEKLLIGYIKDNQKRRFKNIRDDWKDLCKNDIPLVCKILLTLYKENIESFDWWNDAFYNWRDESLVKKSWDVLSNEIVNFQDVFFVKCGRYLSDWLNTLSSLEFNSQDIFLELINQIISKYNDTTKINEDFVSAAINNPVGICIESLQNLWFSKKPSNNSLINQDLATLYTKICNDNNSKFISGKVILASNVLFLYQVDSSWTKDNLIPLFDWENDELIATAVWQGYLWNPRSNINLIGEIKEYLVQTAFFREELSQSKDQYIRLISSIGVYNQKIIKFDNIRDIIYTFNNEELIVVIDYLNNIIKNTEDNLDILWDEKIYPFFQSCFPNSKSTVTKDLSQRIAFLCINSGVLFNKVYDKMNFYLIPIEYPDLIFILLEGTQIFMNFPKESLDFIYKLINEESRINKSTYLKKCLELIIESDESLKNIPQYKELIERI